MTLHAVHLLRELQGIIDNNSRETWAKSMQSLLQEMSKQPMPDTFGEHERQEIYSQLNAATFGQFTVQVDSYSKEG